MATVQGKHVQSCWEQEGGNDLLWWRSRKTLMVILRPLLRQTQWRSKDGATAATIERSSPSNHLFVFLFFGGGHAKMCF